MDERIGEDEHNFKTPRIFARPSRPQLLLVDFFLNKTRQVTKSHLIWPMFRIGVGKSCSKKGCYAFVKHHSDWVTIT